MPPGLKQAARAERGGACREGRGLLLGLAQEMRRGRGLSAACLDSLFTPGGGALTRRREGERENADWI